jgi:hypothetical protein
MRAVADAQRGAELAAGASMGAAFDGMVAARVIQTVPNCFGQPWINPRISDTSWSTKMNGQ